MLTTISRAIPVSVPALFYIGSFRRMPRQRHAARTRGFMREAGEETVTVSGDLVLIEVLEAAQRFVAWYAEFLSRDGGAPAQRGEEAQDALIASKLQHAVFDLMAAVHAMNRHCTATHRQRTVSAGPLRTRQRDGALH
jgi:hypothetical protein